MPTNVPASKASDLLDRIVRAEEGDLTEFQLLRFERDAKSLMHADPAHAHELLGVIATHKRDLAVMREEFRIAQRLDPSNLVTRVNFAKALGRFGLLQEAYEQILAVHETDPLDVNILRETVVRATEAGAYQAAEHLNEKLRKLEVAPYEKVTDITRFLTESGLSDAELIAAVEVASSVFREQNLALVEINQDLLSDSLAVRYVVKANPDIVADANFEIATRLCTKLPDPLDRSIVFGCRST